MVENDPGKFDQSYTVKSNAQMTGGGRMFHERISIFGKVTTEPGLKIEN
jgi:hypothetical protein